MIWRRSPPLYDAIASPGVFVNREIIVHYERNIDVNVPRREEISLLQIGSHRVRVRPTLRRIS